MSSMGGHIGFPGFSLYHTTKWEIEGFFEAFAPEVEPFGIRTTLIEPGMIRTSFYAAVQHAPVLEAYANNPAIRRGDTRLADMPGDQAKVVAAMIDVAGADDPPRRAAAGLRCLRPGARGAGGPAGSLPGTKRRGVLHRRRRLPADDGLSGERQVQASFDTRPSS